MKESCYLSQLLAILIFGQWLRGTDETIAERHDPNMLTLDSIIKIQNKSGSIMVFVCFNVNENEWLGTPCFLIVGFGIKSFRFKISHRE